MKSERYALITSGNIDQNDPGVSMSSKQISDVEAFVNETEKARKIPLSKEDIKRINDLAREVESEDSDTDDESLSIVAKGQSETNSTHIQG